MRAVVEPLSSIAFRKVCETVGFTSPAQASQAAAGISATAAWTSLWLSQDGIPMKCDARLATDKGRVSTIRWELRHVKIGTQDAALFEIPRDYAKLSPEAAAPLLGMRLARPPAR